MINSIVIVLSDRASKGIREDKSGEILVNILKSNGFDVKEKVVIPDEKRELENLFKEYVNSVDFIVTSGGTGITNRDITPDVTEKFIEKRLSGFEYAMVHYGLKHTPMAAISRAVAGINGNTFIINLPGNPKAIEENFIPLIPAIKHLFQKLKNQEEDCGEQIKRL